MHDPMTLAFDVRLGKVRLLEIWHVDPETDGSDDSCGWTYPHLTEDEGNYAHSLIYDKFDNVKNWFASSDDAEWQMRRLFRIYKARMRSWWKHPRWHIHHWEIKVVPVFKFKRWLFTRCAHCGGLFSWGYAPVTTRWNSPGPRWFKSEEAMYHHECLADNESNAQAN